VSNNSENTTPGVSSGEITNASTSDSRDRTDETPFARVVHSLQKWWQQEVIGAVDQAKVIEKHREDCALSERYIFMTAMSGGIAVLGLLLPSTAVVIGAMLLSPLMGPIMGLGFALAIGDYRWLKQSARSLAWGSVIAITLCAVIVFFSPIQTVTPEIASRTQPNLFDLLVALFSGMAGAYATIRGRAGAIVGVAIATALMPPLAVVGFGLATANWPAFSGALLLFVTNLITIALTAWAMARLYGFRTSLSARQTQFQNFMVVAVFIGLAIPLAFSLQRIAWEANAQRVIRSEIEESFVEQSAIDKLDVEFRSDPIVVSATVFTPTLQSDAEVREDLQRALKARLSREITIGVTQIEVARGASAAERAQLAAASEQDQQAAAVEVTATDIAKKLALVAGVEEQDVTVDRTRRRAMVRAQRLEGATMAVYHAFEQRISATEPDWTIELLPPSSELPDAIPFQEDGPTVAGARALSTIEWAATRIDRPIVLIGDAAECAQAAEILALRGVDVTVRAGSGTMRAEWARLAE